MNSGEACEGERVLLGAEQVDGDPMTCAFGATSPAPRGGYSAAGASRLVCALAAARRCAVTRPPMRAPARDRSNPSGEVGPVEAPP